MRVLLDTHIFLWWYSDAPELPGGLRRLLLDPSTEVVVSAASVWEIAVKRSLGKLDFEGSVVGAIQDEGFAALAISAAHAEHVGRLPDHHRDPFDRLLVAHSNLEDLTLLSVDPQMSRYDVFALRSS